MTGTSTDTSSTKPSYLLQAKASSIGIQRQWIEAVLRESAASTLRKLVLERALLARQSRQYDDSSISSIEDESADSKSGKHSKGNKKNQKGEEVVVTHGDIDAAYELAERLGRAWAEALAKDQDDGTSGIQSAADLVLEVVEAGRFLEDKDEDDESINEDENGDGNDRADGSTAHTDEPNGAEDGEDADGAPLLAKPQDAITTEVALSRLTTPHSLLIGHKPFGTLLDRIPPNPVLSAAVATMVNTSPDDIKAKNEAADRWRQSISAGIDELGRNGKTGWMYPWGVIERACDYNTKRMESGRNAAITTSEISSGRAAPVVVEQLRSRKRQRSDEPAVVREKEKEHNSTPIVSRPPADYSSQVWTISDVQLSLGERVCKMLENEMLHHRPNFEADGEQEDGGERQQRRASSPLPPTCTISGYLHHLGSIQLWEKSKSRISSRSDDVKDDVSDGKKARRKRKRMYRKAKAERLSGDRSEKDNDARLDIEKRISKVTRAFEDSGEGHEGPEWFELDIGGCLVELGGEDKKDTVAFRSMEVSLSLDD